MDFPRQSARYLREVYLPRLRTAVEALPEADLWWRPHSACTSAGHLLKHLEGNVRQWILAGLGGAPDARRRGTEFEDGGGDREALLARLEATVRAACDVIERTGARDGPRTIQGFETTTQEAIYHVVEHFAWHTGQLVWMAKLRAGAAHGIAFYDDGKLNA